METGESIEALALRLLELERRFQSYCDLHDEELREIRTILHRLREDVLARALTSSSSPGSDGNGEPCSEEEVMEDSPISAL